MPMKTEAEQTRQDFSWKFAPRRFNLHSDSEPAKSEVEATIRRQNLGGVPALHETCAALLGDAAWVLAARSGALQPCGRRGLCLKKGKGLLRKTLCYNYAFEGSETEILAQNAARGVGDWEIFSLLSRCSIPNSAQAQ